MCTGHILDRFARFVRDGKTIIAVSPTAADDFWCALRGRRSAPGGTTEWGRLPLCSMNYRPGGGEVLRSAPQLRRRRHGDNHGRHRRHSLGRPPPQPHSRRIHRGGPGVVAGAACARGHWNFRACRPPREGASRQPAGSSAGTATAAAPMWPPAGPGGGSSTLGARREADGAMCRILWAPGRPRVEIPRARRPADRDRTP